MVLFNPVVRHVLRWTLYNDSISFWLNLTPLYIDFVNRSYKSLVPFNPVLGHTQTLCIDFTHFWLCLTLFGDRILGRFCTLKYLVPFNPVLGHDFRRTL